jgi:hypothetical protein
MILKNSAMKGINGMNPGASPGWYFAPRGGECTQKDLFKKFPQAIFVFLF